MPPMNLNWKVFGRPVKPVAFSLMLTMLIIAWAAIVNVGVLGASVWADVLLVLTVGVAALTMVAWVRNSQRLTERALLSAFFVWGIRFWLVVLVADNPVSTEGLYLSVCWMIVAGGSYLLEKTDPRTRKVR
jgi:type IV secretory pathway VirB3-like protein